MMMKKKENQHKVSAADIVVRKLCNFLCVPLSDLIMFVPTIIPKRKKKKKNYKKSILRMME